MERSIPRSPFMANASTDIFLWVSHGNAISGNNNYYPVRIYSKAVLMYSQYFETITTFRLHQLLHSIATLETNRDVCKLLLSACPYMPITSDAFHDPVVFLPPLVFSVEEDADELIQAAMGLYHIKITAHPDMTCSALIFDRILSTDDLKAHIGRQNAFTYASIFRLIKKQCEIKKIDYSQIVISIFSCQSPLPHVWEVKNVNRVIIPTIKHLSQHVATVITSVDSIANQSKIIPLVFPITTNTHTLLTSVKTHGCGLNVLSFLNIVSGEDATEQIACLDLDGTSIFRMVDYIYAHAVNRTGIYDIRYLVLRNTLSQVVTDLVAMIRNLYSVGMIVKMYASDMFKDKKNDRGHTILISSAIDRALFWIDPQLSFYIPLPDATPLVHVKTAYESRGYTFSYTVADIVFGVVQLPSSHPESFMGEMNKAQFLSLLTRVVPPPYELRSTTSKSIRGTRRATPRTRVSGS